MRKRRVRKVTRVKMTVETVKDVVGKCTQGEGTIVRERTKVKKGKIR